MLAAPQSASGQAGCDPKRPAVAHRPGATKITVDSARAPVPCVTVAGNAIEGATIGVTRSGTVFFASIEQNPDGRRVIVDPSVVARSTDGGQSWQNIVPGGGPISPHGSLSTWLRVDHRTSRLWYATPAAPCGGTVSWSDDDGRTWGHTPNIGCPAQGGVGFMEGPAPAGTEAPRGYPHVVYYCANAQDGDESVLVCHKSLDGGRGWSQAGTTPDPVPAQQGCPPQHLRTTRAGEVGPDGVLYFPTWGCDDRSIGLAVSSDQGRTWTRRHALDAEVQDIYPPAMAIDADGTLYIAWKGAHGLPYLVVSRDKGRSWTPPAMIAPPGVDSMRRLGIVARGSGHVVVSYLASTDEGASYDAYMTVSRNAADREPTFWSAPVNHPASSVLNRGASESFAERIQLLRGHIADDGTPWAAFHCFDTALCPGRRLGLAAALRWPRGGAGAGLPGCLARRAPIGPRNIGRIRLGLTRRQLLRRVPSPRRRGRGAWRWCVKGGRGAVVAAFDRRGRVALAATTAPRHGNRRIHPGSSVRAMRRAYPRSRPLGRGLVRANRTSPRLLGIRRGRVRHVAVASRATIRKRKVLRAYLRRARLAR